MTFRLPLRLEYLNGRDWLLIEPLRYERANGTFVEVPAGFVTDFASVPRFFWRVLPPTGDYGKAAVLHDFLYRHGFSGGFGRRVADLVFLEAMRELGVPWWKRSVMYAAVRLFGRWSFRDAPAVYRDVER